MDYLDLTVTITEEGKISTDVFSKNSNSYLPPFSCHAPSVFKGLGVGIGTRLRMLVSDDEVLENRINEYAKYLSMSGWKWTKALRAIKKGASKNRQDILCEKPKKRNKKIAWITTHDPRVPSKDSIIQKNLHLLHADPNNLDIFPRSALVAADRKRKNLGQMFMPTVPRRTKIEAPKDPPGFYPCDRCDTCRHSEQTTSFTSPWDGRRWKIRQHITCTTKGVVYLLRCRLHPDLWYIGSTTDLHRRWAGHKSDIKLKRRTRCKMADHVHSTDHPSDPHFNFMYIVPIEIVKNENHLLAREIYWQANTGALFVGLNRRNDLNSALHQRVHFQ